MPSWRNKPKSEKGNYQKRRSFEQGKAEIDAAHRATFRLYGDALRLWRRCAQRRCRRHRCCLGDAQHCFGRAWPFVPPSLRRRAQKQVHRRRPAPRSARQPCRMDGAPHRDQGFGDVDFRLARNFVRSFPRKRESSLGPRCAGTSGLEHIADCSLTILAHFTGRPSASTAPPDPWRGRSRPASAHRRPP